MANCGIIAGLNAQECFSTSGGIKKFFVANFDQVTGITQTDSAVTLVSMSGASGFYEFQPNMNSSSWTEEGGGDAAAGTFGNSYTQTLTAVFSKKDSTTINNIKLAARKPLMVVVQETNGDCFLLGQNQGMGLKPSRNSGTVITDANAFTLTFTSFGEYDPAPSVAYSGLTII